MVEKWREYRRGEESNDGEESDDGEENVRGKGTEGVKVEKVVW